MNKFKKVLFERKKDIFIKHLRKIIFLHQYYEDLLIDLVIYYDLKYKEFWIEKMKKNYEFANKNIKTIFRIRNWFKKDLTDIDFTELHQWIYIVLMWWTKDEVKSLLASEIKISNNDLDILYSQLLNSVEETKEDWMFYGVIENLAGKNKLFAKYIKIRRCREYVVQKMHWGNLKYIEKIVRKFKIEL